MRKRLLFVGPVLTASGYGVHARQLLRALVDCGDFDVAVESIRWGETAFLSGPEYDWIRELTKRSHQDPQVAVLVTIPNEFRRRAPLTVGVTAGIEVDRVSPTWILKCNSEVDLVVVPSTHSRNAFLVEYQAQDGSMLRLERPVFAVSEGVDTAVFRPLPGVRSAHLDKLGVPDRNFVCTGLGLDKPQGKDRKNITKLVEWFCRAFAGNDRVGLVLKTSIVNGSGVDFELTRKRVSEIKQSTGCGEHPRVFILHGRMTETEMSAVYNDPRVTAMVSLTHGEGFGLPLLEAAACGLPVMATDWSGHTDFLTKDGRKLFVPVSYSLVDIPEECVWDGVMDRGSRWAQPQEQDAQTKMQKLVLSSDTPRTWATELAAHVAENYSLGRTGQAFASLVKQAASEVEARQPADRETFVTTVRDRVRAKGPSLVYTMPMSAGDVLLSTGVVSALKKRHPGHRVYFATSPPYFGLVRDLKGSDGTLLVDEVIEWMPWMQDVSLLEDVFDEAYTPNLAVQMTHSNWVHKGRGRDLLQEFTVQCGLDSPDLPLVHHLDGQKWLPRGTGETWVAVHAGGQKSARRYIHWSSLVRNIRGLKGVKVVQVGAPDDLPVGQVDLDLRGKLELHELPSVLKLCGALVCIDSYPMHAAAVVGTPVVALFGSSYPSSTGPVRTNYRDRVGLPVLLETPDRKGCDRACYKDTCKVDPDDPCINGILPDRVFWELAYVLGIPHSGYVDHRPKISGYTHILNPRTHGYPYVQSILSMMDFCDEVVVVDGGSTDGSVEHLNSELERYLGAGRPRSVNEHSELKVITREWDPAEPGMDGMQKAFGRAMCSPDAEFLWQQDADEVVHESDYGKVIDLCRRFPQDVDVVHLPVVELWGDDRTCRTDRHSWKWRLSRNNLRVTHGINARARQMDPKTGRFFAKAGMSDGCEYIDMMTGEMLPHRGFYSDDLERLRRDDPDGYGQKMNEVFGKLPSVWHYSWADLPRKVRNFRDFWDHQWDVLYQRPAAPRFPDVVTEGDVATKARELQERGGEHGPARTFRLKKDPPRVMEGWGHDGPR